jgi:hypothetical protein
MKVIQTLFVLFIFLSAGCEDISNVDFNIKHDEHIVIKAELVSEQIFKGVVIIKTLPLEETFDIKKAEVKNAEAYLLINGVQIIPIHYTSNGVYKPLYDLEILSGNKYELFCKVEGRSIYAETIVPFKPEVADVIYNNGLYLIGNVIPKINEAYGAIWTIQGNDNEISRAKDYFSVVETSDQLSAELPVRTQDVSPEYRAAIYRGLTYIKVISFDKSFAEYFKTKDKNQLIENTFTSGGGLVAWNVQGEKTIGLFIGLSEGDLIKPLSN